MMDVPFYGPKPQKGVNIVHINPKSIYTDPYLRQVDITFQQEGDFIYSSDKRKVLAGTVAKRDQDKRNLNTLIRTAHFFTPDSDVAFPMLSEGNQKLWMTVEPLEINTHDSRAKKIKGNVLYLGAGLGYSVFRSAADQGVKSIDIVELSPDVKKLCEDQVIGKMPNGDKVKNFFVGDAISFISNEDLSAYNSVDLDIYRDTQGMIVPYLKTLPLEEKYPKTNFSYWIEGNFYVDLQTEILAIIRQMILRPGDSIGGLGYSHGIGMLAKCLVEEANAVINNREDLSNFISFNNLRDLTKDFAINNPSGVKKIECEMERIAQQRRIQQMFSNMNFVYIKELADQLPIPGSLEDTGQKTEELTDAILHYLMGGDEFTVAPEGTNGTDFGNNGLSFTKKPSK